MSSPSNKKSEEINWSEKFSKFPQSQSNFYTEAKKIECHGILQDGNRLVVPCYDSPNGNIVGGEIIEPNYNKKSFPNSIREGSMFPIGDFSKPPKQIAIAEGFATAASIYEATNITSIHAFGCGNLMNVAVKIRKIYPAAEIIMCADNDQGQRQNYGVEAATKVAQKLGAKLAIPEFKDKSVNPIDFNDLANSEGHEKVRHLIKNAQLMSKVPEGFYYKGGSLWKERKTGDVLVGNAIYVYSYSADADTGNHYLGLKWEDDKTKQVRSYMMPMWRLEEPTELFKHLLSHGYVWSSMSLKIKSMLLDFIFNSKPNKQIKIVNKTGYHGSTYVLPDKNYPANEDVILDNPASNFIQIQRSGTLVDWQSDIGKYCIGNPKLMIVTCAAFASPLIKPLGYDSIGFHLVGESSSGKSTALKVGTSIIGNNIETWRATGNALERIAACHNDLCLFLDELGQVNSKEFGQIVYTLSGNKGKARLQSSTSARKPFEWKAVYFSSGEVTLEDKLLEGGMESTAGQEVRMINIPADSDCGLGIYDTIHEFPSPAELSNHLAYVSEKYKGIAFDKFLTELLEEDQEKLVEKVKARQSDFKEIVAAHVKSGQVDRVVDKFALLYASGTLAIDYGILQCEYKDISESIQGCFDQWFELRGTPYSLEQKKVIDRAKYFFEINHLGRFSEMRTNPDFPDIKTSNVAGYKEKTEDGYLYYVTASVMNKEITAGFSRQFALKSLEKAGLITSIKSMKKHIPTLNCSANVYVFTSKVFGGETKTKSVGTGNVESFIPDAEVKDMGKNSPVVISPPLQKLRNFENANDIIF